MKGFYSLLLLLAAGTSVRAAAPPDWLPKYQVAMTLDVESHSAAVVQRVTVTNHFAKPLTELVFNAHSAYVPPKGAVSHIFLGKMLEIMRVSASQGIYDEKALQMKSISLVDAKSKFALAWTCADAECCTFRFPLPKALPPGEQVTVEIEFDFKLPQKQGRWGQWKGVTFLSNWLPVLAFYDDAKGWQPTPFVAWHQPFFNEAGVWEVNVNLPKDQVVACTGQIHETIDKGDWKEVRIGPVTARDFAFLCSPRFKETVVEATNGTRVKCVAFEEHAHYAKAIAGISARAVDQYSKWFGPFPYPELTLVESYFGWNGNECSGLIMVDERVFDMPHLAEGYVEYLVSHETCHQWWYNVIGTNGYRETFMDEAFATYFAHRMLDGSRGRNNAMLEYPKGLTWLPKIERDNYRNSSFFGTLKRGELMAPLSEMDQYRHVGNLFSAAYDRGSKIVGLIEERLGEAAFLEFIHQLARKYHFRILRSEDLQKELETFTGKSWQDFFDRWLRKTGMTDWTVESVKVERRESKQTPAIQQAGGVEAKPEPKVEFFTTVILRQKAEYADPTSLGFSFDGKTYTHTLPVGMVQQPFALDDGRATIGPLPDGRIKVEALLGEEPKQIAVDPDQILPDANPGNNFWKSQPRVRVTPLYTMLDETPLTTAYDRWNYTLGPWVYGPTFSDPWFTRANVIGLRAGAYRTEQFQGGVYTGYRTDFRDVAAGFDAVWSHEPFAKSEFGVNGEMSLFKVRDGGTDLDRLVVYHRYVLERTASLYNQPIHFVEGFADWQKNWLPEPTQTVPGMKRLETITNVGVHYHVDYLTPYWDPEMGARLDVTYAAGIPVFGQDVTTQQVTGQLSGVFMPPEWTGWFSRTKIAWRGWGAFGGPSEYALFTLGGSRLFRGFDLDQRQGNWGWIGSLEWRVPICTESRVSVLDNTVGFRNLYLAPFYDVGNMYVNNQSFGPPAHALGLGFRLDVAWFSFIERTTMRLDVAKSVNTATPWQVWFGITHPF